MICQGCVEGTVYPVIDRPHVRGRKCVVCGGPIPEDAHGTTRICSAECRRRRHSEQVRRSRLKRHEVLGVSVDE